MLKNLPIVFTALIAWFKNLAFRQSHGTRQPDQSRLCYFISTWKMENGDVAYAYLYTRPHPEILIRVAGVEFDYDIHYDLHFKTGFVKFPTADGQSELLAFG